MSALVAEEIAIEQAHVDRVYAELVKAARAPARRGRRNGARAYRPRR